MPNTKYLYKDIFQISKEIELLIQLGNFEKIDALLDKREVLIKQILPEDFTIGEIKELVDRIKVLDEKNFEQLKEFRHEVGKKMNSISRNIKYVGMYKVENTYNTSFIDERN